MLIVVICWLIVLSTVGAASLPPVRVVGDRLVAGGAPMQVKGTNYYPKDSMWGAMWTNWDFAVIQNETAMLPTLGINVMRIMVPYSAGGWNGPNIPSDHLSMLYNLVLNNGKLGIYSLITLFDWETTWPPAGSQLEADHLSYVKTIVSVFYNNPYVIAWDVKNEPDHPNNINGSNTWNDDPAQRDIIVSWLLRMMQAVRVIDTQHPVSTGIRWWLDVETIIDSIDIVLFHSYWPNVDQEIDDVKSYMNATRLLPIVVEEFGWPTNPAGDQYSEALQLQFYTDQVTAYQAHNITGWIQWMTFDAAPYGQSNTFESYFGLWRYDYSPKPVAAFYKQRVSPALS